MTTTRIPKKKAPKLGRPPVDEKRDQLVAARFTAAELDRVKARAMARRQSVSASVALAALEDATKAGH